MRIRNSGDYKGVRSYTDPDGFSVMDAIIIKWSAKDGFYEVIPRFGIPPESEDAESMKDDLKLWASDIRSAKRLALQDTGLKSSDFKWTKIQE